MNNIFMNNVRPIYIYSNRIDNNIFRNSYSNNTKLHKVAGAHLFENKNYDWLNDGVPYVVLDNIMFIVIMVITINTVGYS